MSQYLCPECKTDSRVLDTRPAYTRLRRRRLCNNPNDPHKFSTVEVPVDAPQRIIELMTFALQNAPDPSEDDFEEKQEDMIAYVHSSTREILLGLLQEEP